jgi:alkanesulfonate monooxygenase SsuD/methylene tetrahydromethanopterin reductase-like flavin-dependent oxidoreductase (luciferase family)
MLEWAKLADSLGYDSFWLTEHHFQREGYEVVPNVVLLAAVFAQHTCRIRWHSYRRSNRHWSAAACSSAVWRRYAIGLETGDGKC